MLKGYFVLFTCVSRHCYHWPYQGKPGGVRLWLHSLSVTILPAKPIRKPPLSKLIQQEKGKLWSMVQFMSGVIYFKKTVRNIEVSNKINFASTVSGIIST